jgi:2-polyprenyl-6-methoxyphenol hydroxylase-like FAD-dependent oxidoreductase
MLSSGLEDVVAHDRRVVGYQQYPAGGVELKFADGSSAQGDVLVGADGATSAVRKQLLPDARVVDSGVAGIAGKVYLNERTRALIGERLLRQMTMVLPVRGLGMFMAPFRQPDDRPASASTLDLPEHLFWVLIGREAAFGWETDGRHTSADELRELALRTAARWHPLLRQLIVEADADSLLGVPLHSSEPVAAWPTSQVTLLGDAIHTMTPLQGLGGNTALRDAAVLTHHLARANRGQSDLLESIGAYERDMRQYGFDAVQRSLQVSTAVATTSAVGRVAFRTMLNAINAVPPLGSVLFKRSEEFVPAA